MLNLRKNVVISILASVCETGEILQGDGEFKIYNDIVCLSLPWQQRSQF